MASKKFKLNKGATTEDAMKAQEEANAYQNKNGGKVQVLMEGNEFVGFEVVPD